MEHLFLEDISLSNFNFTKTEINLTKDAVSIRFNAEISKKALSFVAERGNILEIGALVLPLELSHGKDLLYGEPIYSNDGYKIRGYANCRRENGEYTYNDSAVMAVPEVYHLEKTGENDFYFATSAIKKENYCSFYGAQLFIRFLEAGEEKVIYSDYLQTSVYNEAIKCNYKTVQVDEIIDYCKNKRKEIYNKKSASIKKRHIFTAKNIEGFKIRTISNDLQVAEQEIGWYKNGETTAISLITDAHLNYINQRDITEANPSVMSTYEKRIWCCDGQSVPNFLRAMEYASFSDKIVLTGDTMDYYSKGCLQLSQRLGFWNYDIEAEKYNKLPKVVATLGNHEPTRQMEGLIPDNKSSAENKTCLQKFWPNDVCYHSENVYNSFGKNPVKIMLFDNSTGAFADPQADKKLARDLEIARNEKMPVLLFAHVPLFNGTDEVLRGLLLPNFKLSQASFCCRNKGSNPVTDAVYKLITENADIIRGIFTGHQHEYVYTEIKGMGRSADFSIPQHIFQAVSYGNGSVLNILIK